MSVSIYVDGGCRTTPSLDLSNANGEIVLRRLFNETNHSGTGVITADDLEEALAAYDAGSLIDDGLDPWLEEVTIQELTAMLEDARSSGVDLAWS